jgi:putative SOS response-associated peptidase YedK
VYYGTECEAIAAQLRCGDWIIYRGQLEEVRCVWMMDGFFIQTKSGRNILVGKDPFCIMPRALVTLAIPAR